MQKPTALRGIVLKTNIVFLVCILVCLLVLFLWPSTVLGIYSNGNMASIEPTIFRKLETSASNRTPERAPSYLDFINGNTKIGLVNMEEDNLRDWGISGNSMMVQFEQVSSSIAWKDLFSHREAIGKSRPCPELPMPDFTIYGEVDVIIARLPCRKPENGWNRDVFRLQVHMVSANIVVRKGRRDLNATVKVIFLSKCTPMMDIFRSDDLIKTEGEWWMYEVNVGKLEDKLRWPLGSCNFALPIWSDGINDERNTSKQVVPSVPGQREAYASVIHSSDKYVCGAIILAQSIRLSGSTRDLVLLHDESIPEEKLQALAAMGWILRKITLIRNPQGRPMSYNEYNYSKFRLWQLTEYDKVVFIDCDVLVLRNLDVLFSLPQISATNNHKVIFNSGVMVIEPSNCTFNVLMQNHDNLTSYNGGDQGYLNENFVAWHQIPSRMAYLKYIGINSNEKQRKVKEDLFGAIPPKLYSIHYLGAKPWTCHRGYECNRDKEYFRSFVSDAATQRWWSFYDRLDESVKVYCRRPETREIEHL